MASTFNPLLPPLLADAIPACFFTAVSAVTAERPFAIVVLEHGPCRLFCIVTIDDDYFIARVKVDSGPAIISRYCLVVLVDIGSLQTLSTTEA